MMKVNGAWCLQGVLRGNVSGSWGRRWGFFVGCRRGWRGLLLGGRGCEWIDYVHIFKFVVGMYLVFSFIN